MLKNEELDIEKANIAVAYPPAIALHKDCEIFEKYMKQMFFFNVLVH